MAKRKNPIGFNPGKPKRQRQLKTSLTTLDRMPRVIHARFDATQTHEGNAGYWANADNLSPDLAASPFVRRTLRSRARYEVCENNPYLKGIATTICNDFAGRDVRLRITDERFPLWLKQEIEKQWIEWGRAIKRRQKLFQMRSDIILSGEPMSIAVYNDRINHPVKLDWKVIEPDCCTTPGWWGYSPTEISDVDGIRFDSIGNPVAYYILDNHPGGSMLPMVSKAGGRWIDEKFVTHWFRKDRGWSRGIPEITPSLPLCAVLRRFVMAITKHAEAIASMAVVFETEAPPYVEKYYRSHDIDDSDVETEIKENNDFNQIPMESGKAYALPWGTKMQNFDRVPMGQQAEAFVGTVLREICRPLLIPYNYAVGTSKDSNMASAVVDRDMYQSGHRAWRRSCEEDVLEKWFSLWYEWGCATPGYFSRRSLAPSRRNIPAHEFVWDKVATEHPDPEKRANAIITLAQNKLITIKDAVETLGDMNIDYEDFVEELEREKQTVESLGIAPSPALKNKQDGDTLLEDSDRPIKNRVIHEKPDYTGKQKQDRNVYD